MKSINTRVQFETEASELWSFSTVIEDERSKAHIFIINICYQDKGSISKQ